MKNAWRRTLTTLAFATAIAAVAPACTLHASGRLRPAVVVYDQPPPPRQVVVESRPGYIYVEGRWDWQNNNWVWVDGHYERQRMGHAWEQGHWERRGNAWHWIEGRWVAGGSMEGSGGVIVRDHRDQTPPPADTGGVIVRDHRDQSPPPTGGGVVVRDHRQMDYPTEAPPPAQAENPGAGQAGYVYIAGRWDWRRGDGWVWTPGHWERGRARQAWQAGYWELRGDRYIWVEGRWIEDTSPTVRDHRSGASTTTPDGRKNEVVPVRRGH
jgi:hypothetical protein